MPQIEQVQPVYWGALRPDRLISRPTGSTSRRDRTDLEDDAT